MIYVLGKETSNEYEDLDEIVLTASTKIDDVLKYAYTNLSLNYLYEYAILFVDGNGTSYDYIGLYNDMYNDFIKYTPNVFLKEENKNEYHIVKDCLFKWNNIINEARRIKEEERNRKIAACKEEEERRLYEQLKAKFEG